MTGLDEEEELLLAHARRAFTPGHRQAARVRAAVLASVALPGAATGTATTGSPGAVATGGKAAGAAHGVGAWSVNTWLLGALLAVGAAGAGLLAWRAAETESARNVALAPRASSATRPAPSTRELERQPAPKSAPSVMVSPSATATAPEPQASSSRRAPRAAAAKAGVPALELRDELTGVREAEHALNAGDPARALAVLAELESFPGGSLREERAALGILAHCKLGTADSRVRASRFSSTYAGSVYVTRIRAACGE